MENKPQSKADVGSQVNSEKLTKAPPFSEVVAAETIYPTAGNTINQRSASSLEMLEPGIGPILVFEDLATALSTATGRNSKSKMEYSGGSSSSLDATGSIVGNYEILSVLGRGGMGIVYKAKHRTLKRIVALKMIQTGLKGGSSPIQRFLSEAQSVATLQHPGIVQIFEVGEHQGLPYFCLEYVDGEDLLSSLRWQPWASKPAAELVATLCDAMQYAHDHQVLHRDIKPANILLDSEKRAKISDFGLSRRLDSGDPVSCDGAVMGTPSYMPPEQARGDRAAMSPRSDVYSIGAVLYHMVTGRAPFVSDSVLETLEQVVHRDLVHPRELQPGMPVDLETICLKALQKVPSNRYPSCEEFGADLRRFLRGENIAARPTGRMELLTRWCRRHPMIAWPTAVASLCIITTSIVSVVAWRAATKAAMEIAAERDDANEQRHEADKQKVVANQQRAQAEVNSELAIKQAKLALQNIQFIVTDIDGKLSKQAGTSELRIAMLETLSKKWDEIDLAMVGGIRGESIPTLMKVRHDMATALSQLDRMKEADQEYTKLEKMGRERVVLREGIDASRLNLAKILMTSSLIQRRVDNVQGAEQKLLEAREIVTAVIKQPKPDVTPTDQNEVQLLLAAINQNLGTEYLRQGRVADAEKAFSNAIESNEEILKKIQSQPGFANLAATEQELQASEVKCAIDKAKIGVAYVLLRLGRTDEALEKYDTAISSRRSELIRYPNGFRNQTELASQLSLYGRSLLWLNKTEEAEPILNEAVMLSNLAFEADPEKADLKRALAMSLYGLGTLRDLQGKSDEALGVFERSRVLRADLYKSSPDEKNGIGLMRSEARVGSSLVVKEMSDRFAEATKPNPELHLDRACALAQAGRKLDAQEKAVFNSEALSSLERAIAEGYMEPFRVSRDPELLPLAKEPRFINILRKLGADKLETKN